MCSFKEKFIRSKAKIKYKRLLPYLVKGEKILDIGTGNGALCKIMLESGFNMQSLDITNNSFFKEVSPKMFDGNEIPYPDRSFDTAILITVLHHTNKPEKLIEEASRVAKRIIIMEDIYTNPLQKHLTFLADSLANLEFSGHPHSNKTNQEWQAVFKNHKLEIISQNDHPNFLLLFRQVTYVLKKDDLLDPL